MRNIRPSWLRCFSRQHQVEAQTRNFLINDRLLNAEQDFPGNRIRTTKYTWYTFLPRGLFEQFRRAANLYFLFHMCLTLTPISPVSPITSILPLCFVVGVAMLKELWEDVQRGRSDYEVNRRKVEVLDRASTQFRSVHWMDVRVGDIVRVGADSFFPADLICIRTSLADGSCHVETMNLDGETNLKQRRAVPETAGVPLEDLGDIQGTVECEEPNMSIYTFVGKMRLSEQEGEGEGGCVFLRPEEILLRGSKLRNTEWVVGVAVYTGPETKIMMNSINPPSKRSFVELRLDFLIVFQMLALFSACFVTAVGFAVILTRTSTSMWYVRPGFNLRAAAFNAGRPGLAGLLQFFTSVILYGYFVPISLYVTLELVKIGQASMIRKDMHLYYEDKNIPMAVRTSNLNDELGMIHTVLSDKTGTLTRNQMEFFKCSIAGASYGVGRTEVEKAAAEIAGKPLPEFLDEEEGDEVYVPEKPLEKGFNMRDPRLDGMRWLHSPDAPHVRRFLEVLSVCQTVVVNARKAQGSTCGGGGGSGPGSDQEVDLGPDPDTIEYMAESPDEAAFVVAAKRLGYFFYGRRGPKVLLREFGEGWKVEGEREYELLNTLAFTSHRKRMSVIVWDPQGRLLLLAKGADSVMLPRLSPAEEAQRWRAATEKHMTTYAEAGLRTLVIAYRTLDEAEYSLWKKRWLEAQQDVGNAEAQAEKLEGLAEEVEKDLVLLGATGIEDKLQVGVPQTIEKLAQAGIKVWVLTGDKLETAINIGYACNLLRHHMAQHMIILEDNEAAEKEARKRGKSFEEFSQELVEQQMTAVEHALALAVRESHALVVDGKCLAVISAHAALRTAFLRSALRCESVICCRVSPRQKAQVTALLRTEGGQRCLAIGDGANDVGMIQKANVGVGIAGEEGQQAAMASDFAVGQFRFLERLMLVHGGWCYKRQAFLIQYFFYKSLMLGLSIVLYNTSFALCSGAPAYYEWFYMFYQVFFTALPIIFVAIMDQDVKAVLRLRFPGLYQEGQQNRIFSWNRIYSWLGAALFQASLSFAMVFLPNSAITTMKSGLNWGVVAMGATQLTTIILTVNLELLLSVQYLTWINHFSSWLTIFLWFLFLIVGSALPYKYSGKMKGLFGELAPVPAFWFICMVTVGAMMVPTIAIRGISRYVAPMDYNIVQEIARIESKKRESMEQGRRGCGLTQYVLNAVARSSSSARPTPHDSSANLVNASGNAHSNGNGSWHPSSLSLSNGGSQKTAPLASSSSGCENGKT